MKKVAFLLCAAVSVLSAAAAASAAIFPTSDDTDVVDASVVYSCTREGDEVMIAVDEVAQRILLQDPYGRASRLGMVDGQEWVAGIEKTEGARADGRDSVTAEILHFDFVAKLYDVYTIADDGAMGRESYQCVRIEPKP